MVSIAHVAYVIPPLLAYRLPIVARESAKMDGPDFCMQMSRQSLLQLYIQHTSLSWFANISLVPDPLQGVESRV